MNLTIVHASEKKEEGTRLFREGRLDEARAKYLEALTEAQDSDMRLALTNNLQMVEYSAGNLHLALSYAILAAPLCEQSTNEILKGNYHNTHANTRQKLGHTDIALIEYEAAKESFHQAGNQELIATVENNIIFLLISVDRADEALERLDEARKQFTDPVRIAEIDDTRALAFHKLGNKREAFRAASDSYLALVDTDEVSALEKTKQTLRMILE